MHPLERAVGLQVQREGAPAFGESVVVGVSAGSDSMALLRIFAALAPGLSLRILAVYVNHGLRPAETPAELRHVFSVAGELGMEAKSVAVNTAAYAEENKYSREQAARELRYRALEKQRSAYGAEWIAVAHTADDQAEEVLLRLLRGSSRKALSGMRFRQGRLLRPLLHLGKSELQRYCRERGLSWCHDSSNDDLSFLRNRIRHNLLPQLEKEYDPGLRNALRKTAENLAWDEELLEELTQRMWQVLVPEPLAPLRMPLTIERKVFLSYHTALQRRFVERLLWAVGNTARYAAILKVVEAFTCGRTGSELHLNRGLRVQVGREEITFAYPRGKGPWRG